MRLQERANTIRRLCDSLEIDPQILLVIAAYGIEVTDTLEIASVTTISAVRDNQVIKRPFLRASARQANTYHSDSVI